MSNEATFKAGVTRFLAYSNNSFFYLVMAFGLAVPSILLGKLFSLDKVVAQTIPSFVVILSTSILVGMLLWRSSVNFRNLRVSVNEAFPNGINDSNHDSFVKEVQAQKKTSLYKTRSTRTFFSFVLTIGLGLLVTALNIIADSKGELSYSNDSVIFLLIANSISLVIIIITSLAIAARTRKLLHKE
jgi:anaerobic C4-dicarboxylate transporter